MLAWPLQNQFAIQFTPASERWKHGCVCWLREIWCFIRAGCGFNRLWHGIRIISAPALRESCCYRFFISPFPRLLSPFVVRSSCRFDIQLAMDECIVLISWPLSLLPINTRKSLFRWRSVTNYVQHDAKPWSIISIPMSPDKRWKERRNTLWKCWCEGSIRIQFVDDGEID